MAGTIGQNLTIKQRRAALLAAEDEQTDEQICASVGISRDTLHRWKQQPEFTAAMAGHIEAFKNRALTEGFADKRARVKALNTVATALLSQLADSQYQHVTFITEDGAHVYGFDVPRLKELRGTLDDIAKEMGDRRQGKDVAVTVTDYRQEAEAIAAEIGKPELVDAIERDLLISVEHHR